MAMKSGSLSELTGKCLCGAVSWSYSGPITRKLACHCMDCQRATSSPFTAFIGLIPNKVQWVGNPNHFESSPGTHRGFCPTCGTRLYFRSDQWPGEIHIHAATLDDGTVYTPDKHVKYADRPDWLQLDDDLPRLDGFDAVPNSRS